MFRVSMLLAMSCWAWIRSATPWAKAVSPRPRSVTTWPRRHRFCDRSGVRLRVQVDFKFARPEAQFPASFDERGRVHCLGKWQAGFVEILRYACRDEDRFGIPADPDELAVGKCVGNKILGGGIARHQRCALGGDKDHHSIEKRSEERRGGKKGVSPCRFRWSPGH